MYACMYVCVYIYIYIYIIGHAEEDVRFRVRLLPGRQPRVVQLGRAYLNHMCIYIYIHIHMYSQAIYIYVYIYIYIHINAILENLASIYAIYRG